MGEIIKTAAQLGDLYATLTSNIPVGFTSNLVLMINEKINSNERNSYTTKMKKLAQQGYESYVEARENGMLSDLGLPLKSKVMEYISSCFANCQIPTIIGLTQNADATYEEAKVLMGYLERSWSMDTEYINATRILACITELDVLKNEYTCFREFSEDSISNIQKELALLRTKVNKLNNDFTKYIDSLKPFKDSYGELYDYTSKKVPFIGRDNELKELQRFCDHKRKVLWWSITGNAGVGKSRLAYELCQKMIKTGWKCVFLSKGVFSRIVSLQEWTYPGNLLLVIDYTSHYGKEIGKWLEKLNRMNECPSSKIRILLIERTKYPHERTTDSVSYLSALDAPWIEEIQRGIDDVRLLEHMCYKGCIMQLGPLDYTSLHDIVTGTISSYNDRSITEDSIVQLLTSLKTLDPDLSRPLYLLFLVQIWVDDPYQERPSRFIDLAEYIYKKEQKRIQNIMGEGDPEEYAEKLMLLATITQQFSFDDPILVNGSIFQENIDQNHPQTHNKRSLRRKLQRLFGSTDNACIISPLKPSLFGEYFVLRTFYHKPDLLNEIIQAAWRYAPRYTTIFLERIIVDYYEFSSCCDYYGIADMDDGIFQKPQIDNEVTETYYADLLVDLSATTTDANNAITAAIYLQRLYSKYPTSTEIWTCFAKALMNLTNKPIDINMMSNSIDTLRSIASRKDSPLSVKIELAKGLFNLGANYVSNGMYSQTDAIVQELKTLWEENNVYEIELRYIKSLIYFN